MNFISTRYLSTAVRCKKSENNTYLVESVSWFWMKIANRTFTDRDVLDSKRQKYVFRKICFPRHVFFGQKFEVKMENNIGHAYLFGKKNVLENTFASKENGRKTYFRLVVHVKDDSIGESSVGNLRWKSTDRSPDQISVVFRFLAPNSSGKVQCWNKIPFCWRNTLINPSRLSDIGQINRRNFYPLLFLATLLFCLFFTIWSYVTRQ